MFIFLEALRVPFVIATEAASRSLPDARAKLHPRWRPQRRAYF
jgi:hypothetical protein